MLLYLSNINVEAGLDLGDNVVDRGGLKGRVVANIDRDEFSPEYPKSEWANLVRGVLVETDEAGLVHYENPAELTPIHSS